MPETGSLCHKVAINRKIATKLPQNKQKTTTVPQKCHKIRLILWQCHKISLILWFLILWFLANLYFPIYMCRWENFRVITNTSFAGLGNFGFSESRKITLFQSFLLALFDKSWELDLSTVLRFASCTRPGPPTSPTQPC